MINNQYLTPSDKALEQLRKSLQSTKPKKGKMVLKILAFLIRINDNKYTISSGTKWTENGYRYEVSRERIEN